MGDDCANKPNYPGSLVQVSFSDWWAKYHVIDNSDVWWQWHQWTDDCRQTLDDAGVGRGSLLILQGWDIVWLIDLITNHLWTIAIVDFVVWIMKAMSMSDLPKHRSEQKLRSQVNKLFWLGYYFRCHWADCPWTILVMCDDTEIHIILTWLISAISACIDEFMRR
jgi:MFS superfamily sulfate permease-like transporter